MDMTDSSAAGMPPLAPHDGAAIHDDRAPPFSTPPSPMWTSATLAAAAPRR